MFIIVYINAAKVYYNIQYYGYYHKDIVKNACGCTLNPTSTARLNMPSSLVEPIIPSSFIDLASSMRPLTTFLKASCLIPELRRLLDTRESM